MLVDAKAGREKNTEWPAAAKTTGIRGKSIGKAGASETHSDLASYGRSDTIELTGSP